LFRRDARNRRKIFKVRRLLLPLEILARASIFGFAQADARLATPRALRVSICFAKWQANWSA
jgi:hypothetical protein